jgi:L-lactate dehydrogenase complex protein LldF
VKIQLHHHLLHNRRNAVRQRPSFREKLAFKAFVAVMNRPAFYKALRNMIRTFQPFHRLVKGTRFDPAYPWTRTRGLPPIAKQTFREYWRKHYFQQQP